MNVHEMKLLCRDVFLLIAVLSSASLLAAPTCDEIKAELDRRLSVGGHAEMNVMIARQMQGSISQMCGYLDDNSRTDMFSSIANILPLDDDKSPEAQTKEERDEERQRQRDEADERRARNNAEKARRAKISELPVHPLLEKPPTLSFRESRMLPRSDQKYGITLLDVELRDGELRILYETFPSREQYASGDQLKRVYVSRLSANGVSDTLIAELASGTFSAVGLRRGSDEVLLQTQQGADSRGELQRWSDTGDGLISSAPVPHLEWAGRTQPTFSHSTGDGAVIFTGATQKGRQETLFHWARVAADGEVLASGTLDSPARATVGNVDTIQPYQGPAAFVVSYTMRDEQGIASQLAVEPQITVGEHVVGGVISAETRIRVLSNDGVFSWESEALVRQLHWPGIADIPRDDYVRLGNTLTTEMQIANMKYGATLSIASKTGIGRVRQNMITALKDGYGVLLKNSYSNPDLPPVEGSWLREVFPNAPTRDTYLRPFAKQLGGEIHMLSRAGDDELVLFSGTALLLLDADREPVAYARTPTGIPSPFAVFADSGGAWLLAMGDNANGQQALWFGRVDFQTDK